MILNPMNNKSKKFKYYLYLPINMKFIYVSILNKYTYLKKDISILEVRLISNDLNMYE